MKKCFRCLRSKDRFDTSSPLWEKDVNAILPPVRLMLVSFE